MRGRVLALGAVTVAVTVLSVAGVGTMGVLSATGAGSGSPEPAPAPAPAALHLSTPHLGPLELRAGCRSNPFGKPFNDPATGTTDFAKVPRWVAVGNLRLGTFPGCIPRELLFPELDGGAALADLKNRAGGPFANPPDPIFAPSGDLFAWMIPRIGPMRPAEAKRYVPAKLLANPPTAAQYERNPR